MILDGWQRECLEQEQIRTVQERKLQYSEYDRGYNKGRADGAREFAEWLATKRGFSKEWVEWHIDHWKKGTEQ